MPLFLYENVVQTLKLSFLFPEYLPAKNLHVETFRILDYERHSCKIYQGHIYFKSNLPIIEAELVYYSYYQL